MIEYPDKVMKIARNLRIRFSIVNMRDQCNSKIENFAQSQEYSNIFEWIILKKEFNKLLSDYDNDIRLNEEFIIQLYNIKFNDNILVIKRLIKLIKIV